MFQEFEGEYEVNTEKIMELSLKLAGLKEVPEDTSNDHMVGLGRFELPSRAPEAQSLDQASRQPLH